jgi:uncharacterized HhH-GPD family protein
MTTSTYHRPASIELTTDADANRLLGQDPNAFLIGWLLDQQVRVQVAFSAPHKLLERIGSIEPTFIAKMPVAKLIDAFVQKPVLHRYGRSLAARVHECMQLVVERYDGDPERIWLEAADYEDLRVRLLELPGIGPQKVPAMSAMLARRFGLPVSGFEGELPSYGSLSEVVEYDDLLAYQERKREFKAARRAARQ